MTKAIHLIVEQGADRGLRITIPGNGARMGRSSKNDIVLLDPLLSRHHCRVFFKPQEGLWVADLGSANETIVNGAPVQESRLHVGDKVTLGDTVLHVVSDGIESTAATDAVFDLGLAPAAVGANARPLKITRGPLLVIAGLVAALAIAVWVPRILTSKHPNGEIPTPPPPPPSWPIEIYYEKVEASPDNIFRYELRLDARRVLSVKIDDIKNDRHVRKEKMIDEEFIRYQAKLIDDAGFFGLSPEYKGLQPDLLESWSITATIGRRTHASTVVNRVAPDTFAKVRDLIEECGKKELGLWAIQFSPDKLVEMARDTLQLAKKLYDEREVKHGNLAAAIQSYAEADWYLETVEPKPAYYKEIVAGKAQCKDLLDQQFEGQNFKAKRAMRLRQWDQAVDELRVILEMIPNRSDPRHAEARKELIEMENRLRMEDN